MAHEVSSDSSDNSLSPEGKPEPKGKKIGKKTARQKKREKKMLVISIIVLVLLVGGGIGGYLLFFPDEPSYTPRFPDDFKWVDISRGTFIMGNSNGRSNEKPAHQVTISKGFQILRFEVTQAQWEAVIGSNPSYYLGNNNPVEVVSWNDCQSFISSLNKLDSNYTYRLPTEAEWEYCCRAGSDTNYSFGDDEEQLGDYAWYGYNSKGKTHQVGQKLPNAWGLYDMHGNVQEWCQDWYDENYYYNSPNINPQGPNSGMEHVIRGDSFEYVAPYHSSSRRTGNNKKWSGLGFRLVREEV